MSKATKPLNPLATMDKALRVREYQGIPKKIRARYVAMLTARAVRFYIDSQLDAYTVDEDLADGASDTGFYESGHPLRKTDLCNLIHSEEHERTYYKEL